jgi:serine/threonine protein kinase
MPYGGVDVGDFIEKNGGITTKMIRLNNSLIELLEKGIVPMNHNRIFHCDLKAPNILVNEEENILKTRIIDWGLSTIYLSGEKIPDVLLNRPFQYNVPFSNILFTSLFSKQYKIFLDKTKNSNFNYYSVRTFVINYVLEWVQKRGPGHLRTINSIFEELFENDLSENINKDLLIEYEFTFYFIFEYITQILLKYTKNETFEMKTYFDNVFIKNIDVWGFVFSYVPFLEYLHNNYDILSEYQNQIKSSIKDMIVILLESSTEPIDIHKLSHKLHNLNRILSHLNDNKNKIKKNRESSSLELSDTTKDTKTYSKKPSSDKLFTTSQITTNTKTKRKKHLHKKVLKTLKHIKTRNINREWI